MAKEKRKLVIIPEGKSYQYEDDRVLYSYDIVIFEPDESLRTEYSLQVNGPLDGGYAISLARGRALAVIPSNKEDSEEEALRKLREYVWEYSKSKIHSDEETFNIKTGGIFFAPNVNIFYEEGYITKNPTPKELTKTEKEEFITGKLEERVLTSDELKRLKDGTAY